MDTFFVRHTVDLAVDDDWIEQWWNQHRIAVHFPEQRDGTLGPRDNASIEPGTHAPAGAKALSALNALATQGGYVCALYRGHESCLVGYVAPGTSVEPVEAKWRGSDRPAALKTLRLERVRVVRPIEHALLLVGRPIRGALTRWPSARDTISALVEGITLPARLDRLSPDQQEIMVSEFLRGDGARAMGLPQLATLLLPTGRTLKDLDILGTAKDGLPLCAQVTMASFTSALGKVTRLKEYGGGVPTHLLLFCREPTVDHIGPVLIRSLDAVFDAFSASDDGARWMNRALNGVLAADARPS